jgi:DNA-binding HxlR family transcriptional regulator
MYKKKIPSLNCGLDLVGELLYGKWKMRLLFFINEGHKRPSELQRKIPDATARVLFSQLKELGTHQLVNKHIFAQVPLKVEYSLTPLGLSLIPIIALMGEWGDTHQDELMDVINANQLQN